MHGIDELFAEPVSVLLAAVLFLASLPFPARPSSFSTSEWVKASAIFRFHALGPRAFATLLLARHQRQHTCS